MVDFLCFKPENLTLQVGFVFLFLSSKYRMINFQYETSELRLIESMENICDAILEYNMHKERAGSRRFAKGESETMQTLKDLRDRGVKVDLGIPEQVWIIKFHILSYQYTYQYYILYIPICIFNITTILMHLFVFSFRYLPYAVGLRNFKWFSYNNTLLDPRLTLVTFWL